MEGALASSSASAIVNLCYARYMLNFKCWNNNVVSFIFKHSYYRCVKRKGSADRR